MPWHVYLARCADGSLYTGITTDPVRREAAHNAGRGGAYTRSRRPVRLIHVERAAGRGAALRRELAIKKLTRPMKERLVKERLAKASSRGARPAPAEFRSFGRGALAFLRRLARHNEREWFERNRAV